MEAGEGMEIASGTWSKSADGEYSFSFNPIEGYTFEMTYADGEFAYSDDFGPMTFKKAEQSETDTIVGEYKYEQGMENIALTVNADNTFVMEGLWGFDHGEWMSLDGTYEFTVYYDDDTSEVFDVYVNEGNLEFFNDPTAFSPMYLFVPVSEDLGEPDMTLSTEYNTEKVKLYFDTENAGTFVFYTVNPLGAESEVCKGTFTMGPAGLSTIVTDKASDVEEASATMNAQGQLVVTIKYVDAEDGQAATYTFDMPE